MRRKGWLCCRLVLQGSTTNEQIYIYIRTAFVSTNSITQGEQVATIWKPLFEEYGVHIDFAYRTFRWDSEANIKAHVHCVIIGFSLGEGQKPRKLFLTERNMHQCDNINAYLINFDDIFVEGRNKPLFNVPSMIKGFQPTDNGLLTEDISPLSL